MTWIWIVPGLVIVAFVIYRVGQVRAYERLGAEHDPFLEFSTYATNRLKEIGPTTWNTEDSWHDRDRAVSVLEELIHQGSNLATPMRQQVYQTAFLTMLASFQDEWNGYPYEGAEGEKEFDVRKGRSRKSFAFWDSVKDATYPQAPPRMNWENYVYGPKGKF